MRIVIDMQGAQTESRYRGIGRYTMSFAQAVVRNRGDNEIILVLSGLFPDTIEPIRAAFQGILSQENIRVWYAPGPVREEQPGNDARREIAEIIREAFISSLNPDIVHICSLFEGYIDDAVTSIGRFDKDRLVSVTLHDLIPLLSPKQYLDPNPNYKAYYYRKLNSLKDSSFYLAISESSKQEINSALDVDLEYIVNASEGADEKFRSLCLPEKVKKDIFDKFKITNPFVLYTGGADARKNLPRLIQAYANLDNELRKQYQLVFAGMMYEWNVEELRALAKKNALNKNELIFTGYIKEDELVTLYNLCKLYVFPSWHEGFGLPALEAMACGAPVIGANTTSLPEVIGVEVALFDPFDVESITDKIKAALTDKFLRKTLLDNSTKQVKKFSWDRTANIAINAWEKLNVGSKKNVFTDQLKPQHQILVDKISQLITINESINLTELAVNLAHNEGAGIQRQLLVDVSELCQNDASTGVQRVVRSYLHQLLLDPPENFTVYPVYATPTENYRYASQYLARMKGKNPDDFEDLPMRWQRGDIFCGLDMQHHVQIARSAIYDQLRQEGVIVKFLVYDLLPIELAELFNDNNAKLLHEQLLKVIAKQNEAICISKATAEAFENWLATQSIKKNSKLNISWVHVGADLEGSKPSVGMPVGAKDILQKFTTRPTFLSVSTLEPRKAQDQILDAIERLWAEHIDINLVLVGQHGWKVDALVNRINTHPENSKRLFWLKGISDEYLMQVYENSSCLIAASKNEGFGLPLIEAARYKIPVIARDISVFREVAGCAAFYFSGDTGEELAESIKQWLQLYKAGSVPSPELMNWSTWQESTEKLKYLLCKQNYASKQLLVDISELVQRDAQSGIQRVVRTILQQWLQNPPAGYRVEPVYAHADKKGYWYARRFTCQFMGIPDVDVQDERVDAWQGDVFIGLDLQPTIVPAQKAVLKHWRNTGVAVWFVIYDLLPVLQPSYFPDGADVSHNMWLRTIAQFDGVACISQSVSEEFRHWLSEQQDIEPLRPVNIEWFHLGADDGAMTTSSVALSKDAEAMLLGLSDGPSFLMVGTIEPRKGHELVLNTFEKLWSVGIDVRLVIVGKQGWMVENLVDRIRNHPKFGKKLYWLEGVSDKYLNKVYEKSSCLIAASCGEGFGLPLIEAAQHKLPIIARDIPVFREVAGDHAYYFDSDQPEGMAVSLQHWLELYHQGKHPRSDIMPWLSWEESARLLLDKLLGR